MTLFDRYIGIDYSGEGLPTGATSGLQVFVADESGTPAAANRPDGQPWNWSRQQIYEYLVRILGNGEKRTIVGIDHAFSFPKEYLDRNSLHDWSAFLEHFSQRCPTDATRVEEVLKHIDFAGLEHAYRLTEMWTGGAWPVFDFRPHGVAKSTFAGISWLARLRKDLGEGTEFWPFDGWVPSPDASVVCEVYPALFNRRYPWSEAGQTDRRDAMAIARWLQEKDHRGFLSNYFTPSLTAEEKVRSLSEGWILGVM